MERAWMPEVIRYFAQEKFPPVRSPSVLFAFYPDRQTLSRITLTIASPTEPLLNDHWVENVLCIACANLKCLTMLRALPSQIQVLVLSASFRGSRSRETLGTGWSIRPLLFRSQRAGTQEPWCFYFGARTPKLSFFYNPDKNVHFRSSEPWGNEAKPCPAAVKSWSPNSSGTLTHSYSIRCYLFIYY